jgi:hypothetical protein
VSARVVLRLLRLLVEGKVDGVRIAWHARRVRRTSGAAKRRHVVALTELAARADRKLAELERLGGQR